MATVLVSGRTGAPVEVEVSPAVARTLNALNKADRRAEKRRRDREPNFSELFGERRGEEPEYAPDLVVDDPRVKPSSQRRDTASTTPMEGPKVWFAYFLGTRDVWSGDPAAGGSCRICRDAPLRADTVCLGCCRSGADEAIGKPPRELVRRLERAEKERQEGPGTLRGGRGR